MTAAAAVDQVEAAAVDRAAAVEADPTVVDPAAAVPVDLAAVDLGVDPAVDAADRVEAPCSDAITTTSPLLASLPPPIRG